MKFLKPLMMVFGVLLLILLGFGIAQAFFRWQWPSEFGVADWIMAVALGIFCVLIVIAAFGQKFNVKRLGNYALHFGLVFFLVGCLLYTVTGVSVQTAVPINNAAMFSEIERADGSVVELGFSFGINNFEIEYYEPTYTVYRMTEGGMQTLMSDVPLQNGYYDFGKYGKFKLESLVVGNSIKDQIALDSSVVALVNMPVKSYTAHVVFAEGNTRENKDLRVNYPLRKNGCKIYLMSFNESAQSVTLLFKWDIGEPLAILGLVLAMVGGFFHCLAYPAIKDLGKRRRMAASGEGQGELQSTSETASVAPMSEEEASKAPEKPSAKRGGEGK